MMIIDLEWMRPLMQPTSAGLRIETFGVIALFAAGQATAGEAVMIKCEELDAGRPAEMTAVYSGEPSGTLKLKASFVEIELPATMETRESEADGMHLKATGIRAFGPATVIMPDRSAIEACIASKTEPEQVGDEDIFSLLLESCRPSAPLVANPIPVKLSVEIAIMDADDVGQEPDVEVYVKRTYLEKSDVPGGTFAIESFPPPRCALVD
jgi:hypothetical protein